MGWFGGRMQRNSSKAAVAFGAVAVAGFVAPSVLGATPDKYAAIAGLGILLSICLVGLSLVGVVVSLIVRAVLKPVADPTGTRLLVTPAQDLVPTPAQPRLATGDLHRPGQGFGPPLDGLTVPTAGGKPPSAVLIAVAIALALAAWQLWDGFVGLHNGHQLEGDPATFPGMPVADVKWVFDVIFGFVLATAIPLLWGAVAAYRGFGRMLTFAAWLFVVLAIPSLIRSIGAQRFPFLELLTIVAGVAIIGCQRQQASISYYGTQSRRSGT